MADDNLRKRFYYFRDRENRPVITVCLVSNENGEMSRGVAFCSKKDPPKKKTGRNIAAGRAVKAMFLKENFGSRVRKEAMEVLGSVPLSFSELTDALHQHGYYQPVLTFFEQKLLGNR